MTICNDRELNRDGVTLIEILVVVAIMSVLTAIMIPQMRIINKDRNIRETARVVGSVFANASQRAINEGSAGVLLTRHPNFTWQSNYYGTPVDVKHACTTMYTLRSLPPYTGDNLTASTADIAGGVVTIDRPLEHDVAASRLIIQTNDYISFNYSSARYRMLNVRVNPGDPDRLDFNLDLAGYLPTPEDTTGGVDFVIYRQPRKIESSRVELPEGYLIDLRYSGPTMSGTADRAAIGTTLNQPIDPTNTAFDIANFEEIRIVFNDAGAIDWMYAYDNSAISGSGNAAPLGSTFAQRLTGSFHLYVAAYETDGVTRPLDRSSNLWATINNQTGGVNIGYTVPPSGAVPPIDTDLDTFPGVSDEIIDSRAIAIKGPASQ